MKVAMTGKSKTQPIFSSQLLPVTEEVSVVQMLLFDNVSQILPFSAHTKQKVKSRATFWF